MHLVIESTEEGRTLTLTGRGEIDVATLDTLSEELLKGSQGDHDTVVVDLQEVTYIDSAGLGVLVSAHKRMKAEDRALVLRVAHPEMLKLLNITGLDQLFAIERPYARPDEGDAADPG